MLLKILPVFIAALIAGTSVYGETRITKQARGFTRNPTLVFRGVSGNARASSETLRFLKACGWFKVVSGGAGNYSLGGVASGRSLTVTLYNSAGMAAFRFTSSTAEGAREAAKKCVDAVLEKVFKVRGICATRIVFCAKTSPVVNNIYLCDIDGGNIRKLTNYNNLCVEPEWFPDSRSVVYTLYGKSWTDIIQTRLNPRQSRRLASYPGLNTGASISPNGKYLALILSKDRTVELYVKAVNGRARKRLTKSRAVEASPCWSPSGGSICFVSDRIGAPRLYVIGANGGVMRKLPTVGTEAVSPAWSAHNKIAYSAKMAANYAIAVLDLSGKTPSGVITRAAGDWESPSWAPDGRHIVCSRVYGGRAALYVVDSWTGKARPLLSGKNSFTMPSWSGVMR